MGRGGVVARTLITLAVALGAGIGHIDPALAAPNTQVGANVFATPPEVVPRVRIVTFPGPEWEDGVRGRVSNAERVGGDCPSRVSRARKDRRDLRDGPLVHIIYLVAADESDRRFDANGTLACSALALNEWFERASKGWRWRLDTFVSPTGGEFPDVTFVRSAVE